MFLLLRFYSRLGNVKGLKPLSFYVVLNELCSSFKNAYPIAKDK